MAGRSAKASLRRDQADGYQALYQHPVTSSPNGGLFSGLGTPDMSRRPPNVMTPSPMTLARESGASSPWSGLNKGQSRKCYNLPPFQQLSRKEAPLYEDLINYPRAKDKDELRCVMCGLPPGDQCVIPRQNKDVCKDCDKATWQHIQTGVYFKWCKGCKKFLRLGSFSQKLDAAKCDKCRERGRQSYLLKKGKDGEEIRPRVRRNASGSGGVLPPREYYDDASEYHMGYEEGVTYEDEEACHTTPERRQSACSSDDETLSDHSDDEADQTLEKMKLSTNLGLPLDRLQTDPNPALALVGMGGSMAALANGATGGGGSPSGSSTPNNLLELARIHQRIVDLEKQAEQVKVLNQKYLQELDNAQRWRMHAERLEVELARTREDCREMAQELEWWRGGGGAADSRSEGPSSKRQRSDSVNGAAAALVWAQKQGGGESVDGDSYSQEEDGQANYTEGGQTYEYEEGSMGGVDSQAGQVAL